MSFSIIRVEEGPPEEIPDGFKRLMPGNGSGVHDEGVLVEQDEEWLERLKRNEPGWFEDLEGRERKSIEGIPYRMVTHYMAI